MENPLSQRIQETSAPSTAWRVVCLCAAWCGVCRDYQHLFETLSAAHPAIRFQWLDIEDEADIVGDLDIETFPTILIAQGNRARFFGPLLPQAGVLERLVRSLTEEKTPPETGDAVAQVLLARVIAAG